MKKFFLTLIIFISISFSAYSFQQNDIKSGHDVLAKMYETYEGKWYKNLSFTQKTTFYGAKGEVARTQMWYELMSLPSNLAIKFDDKNSNNGILFKSGTQFGYANGQLIQEVERVHDLLVLGFDVYHQAPEATAEQLTSNGYDLSKFYMDEWEGRAVYVVGTDKADSTIPQFWIDTERLVFVRNFIVGRQNTIQEVQFNNYQELGEGWIAPEVIFKANGNIGLLEEYSEIVIPDSLNPEIFNPMKFVETKW